MEIGLVGGAYTDRSPDLNASTCVNLYPVPGGDGGKTVGALRGTAGRYLFAALGLNPVRGMHVFGGLLYAVAADEVMAIDPQAGVVRTVAVLNTTSGRVDFADNGQVMVLVDGRDGWLYSPKGTAVGGPEWAPHAVTLGEFVRPSEDNATGFVYECTDAGNGYTYAPEPTWPTVEDDTVTEPNGGPTWTARTFDWAQITDADFPSATQIAFVGGYFVFDDPANAGRFMRSRLYAKDATDFVEALDFATAEADPDGLVRIFALRGFLWLLGRGTTEVWYPSGDVFPFTPDAGARMERGCAATWSAANVGEVLFWLAEDRQGRVQVVMSSGGAGEVISTPALEHAVAGYAAIEDAVGYAYHEEGHTFYVLTFPTGNATWAFDLTTRLWHRRGRWENGTWTRDAGDVYVRFAGMNLVGDEQLGDICALDPDTYTEFHNLSDLPVRRERVAPQVHAEGRPVRFHALRIDAQTGVGTAEAPDPVIELDWSDDGGHTWGPATPLRASMGAAGAYGGRVIFRRLGLARHRYFRLVIEDAANPVSIMAGYLDAEAGPS